MLNSLSIQNVILIEDLHLTFEKGLCVLTGETGAGKSILLDALGLALGIRADQKFLRQDAQKAVITACFSLSSLHPIWQVLDAHGLLYEGDELIFRRHLDEEGKSKCFLNDQIISQTLMRQLGQQVVEIHGQFDRLLDPKSHRATLDAFGKMDTTRLREAFKIYQDAKKELSSFQEKISKSLERQTFLRFAIDEIEKLGPRKGEEEDLEAEKNLIAHRAKIAEALSMVNQNLGPVLSHLSQSHKALDRIQELYPEKIIPLVDASDRALLESQEILEGATALMREVEGTQQSLESLENRLHALRALGRKYQTTDLPKCLKTFHEELTLLEQGDQHITIMDKRVEDLKKDYLKKAQDLSEMRAQNASALQKALTQELAPLKLEHAKLWIKIETLEEEAWGPSGIDRIEFYAQMNPGSAAGPLASIASGGELSRLMLALKVILSQSGVISTLIFDEIESGTGGAVAAAMGERLKVLSHHRQILAITHSPQIASHGTQHLVVFKVMGKKETTTHIRTLTPEDRQEEIARMLAGEEITEEARAAAKRLMG